MGEADLDGNDNKSRPIVNGTNCPYLLLDIRDKDAFDECHIITGRSHTLAYGYEVLALILSFK